jgi:hypothetical protein
MTDRKLLWARSRFRGDLPEARFSGNWGPQPEIGLHYTRAFLGTDPLSLAANFLFARSRTNRQRMAERVTSTGRRYVQVKA